jgi:hypothetical protein
MKDNRVLTIFTNEGLPLIDSDKFALLQYWRCMNIKLNLS